MNSGKSIFHAGRPSAPAGFQLPALPVIAVACLACIAVAVAASSARAVVLYFDDFSANTSANYTTADGRAAWVHSGANGVGGDSGRVNFPGAGTIYARSANTSFGPIANHPAGLTVSTMFLANTQAPGDAMNAALLGIGATQNLVLANNSARSFELALRTDQLRIRNFSDMVAGPNTGQVFSGTIPITSNHWYEMDLTVRPVGGDNYEVTANLFHWGADGLTGGGLVGSVTETFTNAALAGDPLFAGFGGSFSTSPNRGMVAADNFMVISVPEPGRALLGVFGVLALLGIRRRP